jgi:hypothetical protein
MSSLDLFIIPAITTVFNDGVYFLTFCFNMLNVITSVLTFSARLIDIYFV